jgi:hypothetical protein
VLATPLISQALGLRRIQFVMTRTQNHVPFLIVRVI